MLAHLNLQRITVFIFSSWFRVKFLDYPSIEASINLALKRRLNYTGVQIGHRTQVFVSQPNCKFCGLRLRWYWTTSHFWSQLVQSGTELKSNVIKFFPSHPPPIMPFFTTHWKMSTLQWRIMLIRRIFLQQFESRSLGEYHCLNVKSDIPLLANVFEYFIEICLNYYK